MARPPAPQASASRSGPCCAWGALLYGLRLTMQDIGHVGGLSGVGIDALVLGSPLALARWIKTRWLDLVRFICLVAGGALINRGVLALLGCAAA